MKTPAMHIVSDVHLEVRGYASKPPAGTDIIVAAGDIGIGLQGLQWAASWGLPVIYVPGNHEFEGHDVTRLSEQLRNEAAKHTDVYVLQKDMVTLQGVRFLGATFWTDFRLYGQAEQKRVMDFCQREMPEYATAFHEKRLLRASDTLAWHEVERQWLDCALRLPYEPGGLCETVIVTHHAPHINSVESKYIGQMLTAGFVSNCDELLGRCGLWVHGHMHTSLDYDVHGTRIVCNPRGYVRHADEAQPRFDRNLLIRVPVENCMEIAL